VAVYNHFYVGNSPRETSSSDGRRGDLVMSTISKINALTETLAIAKESFCVMTYADKIRLYLYYRNAPVIAKVLADVAGTTPKNVPGSLKLDRERGLVVRKRVNVARRPNAKRHSWQYAYLLTEKGFKAYREKKQFLCVLPKI
jgi:hypothetical protein